MAAVGGWLLPAGDRAQGWVLGTRGSQLRWQDRRRAPGGRRRSERCLSKREREEISRGLARGECFRAIGKAIGRDHTTISREVNRNGGRTSYRAERADETAWGRARRPKPAKLHLNPELRAVVEEKLCLRWSPEQISRWLRRAYADDSDMQVSHETIYLSLFVQGRGALRRELYRLSSGAAGTPATLEASGPSAKDRARSPAG